MNKHIFAIHRCHNGIYAVYFKRNMKSTVWHFIKHFNTKDEARRYVYSITNNRYATVARRVA